MTRSQRGVSLGSACSCGPEDVLVREREIQESCIVSIPAMSQRQDYLFLFCLRARRCPCMGFNFDPLSTSAMQLLPPAIYYRKIERIQGVSLFVLALDVPAGFCTLLFSVSLRGQSSSLSPIWVSESCSYCNLRKEKERRGKKGFAAFPKQREKMAVVPLADPQASSLEAYRLTSVKA